MRVLYIMHSCFAVEIGETLLLFDYFDKKKTPEVNFEGELPDFSRYKKHYIFASHKHRDHFWLESLKWGMDYPQMRFFLGNDMRFNEKYLSRNGIDPSVKERMITTKPGGSYEVDGLSVRAYGSTDEGVSFLVRYQGKTIFHAGDLNEWSWEVRKGEVRNDAYREQMKREYREELEPLRGTHMDIAFVVMDMRLEENYKNGMDYFLHEMDADVVFPMHMWKRYDLIGTYKKELISRGEEELAKKMMEINQENQVFEL
ncbi:MAG: MBL fold metallo-hydrolase [Lachnospiraceae bacterium]|nr:MBL fold metallo-hydrolase [Lachnospiraceae bacterium]